MQGPCRIDPFGVEGPTHGVCGADADTIVARGLARAIAAGCASHGDHARHLAHVLKDWSRGEASDYRIADEGKLRAVAERVGVDLDGKSTVEVAGEVAALALAEFSEREEPSLWAWSTVTEGRRQTFEKFGVTPYGLDASIAEVMHRTTNGVDADAVNILLGGIKCALADYAGLYIATDLSDILFGTPQPVMAQANLGALKAGAVNVAVHGHNPMLSDIVVGVAPEMEGAAKAAGAAEGVPNFVWPTSSASAARAWRWPCATASPSSPTRCRKSWPS